MSSRPIGVFDSGVGGLSILHELRHLMPQEHCVFLADQAHVPYGEKTAEQLKDLACRITQFLLDQHCKLVVVACNTATCYAIETLRTKFTVPFVGTIPAVKPACEKTQNGVVAVLSTPATAQSPALHALIDTYGKNKKVLAIGCAGLEDAVETGSLHSSETLLLLKKYLAPAQHAGADYIVLGCTHYPFLREKIQALVGPTIHLIDSGAAIARQTARLLAVQHIQNPSFRKGSTRYFTTGDKKLFATVASGLLGKPIEAMHAVL